MFAQLGVVLTLSAALGKIKSGTATALFVLYSVLTGVTFSTLFVVFQLGSLALTFAVTAGMFGVMALYGYFTKSDLSGMGNIMLMGLIGLILASVINIFWQNSMFEMVISGIGVVIFTILTAVDVQRIKALSFEIVDQETSRKMAIMGALTLYLDFINLFLMLLNFLGRKRDQ
jgi:FtsH-binding integral membrane protein